MVLQLHKDTNRNKILERYYYHITLDKLVQNIYQKYDIKNRQKSDKNCPNWVRKIINCISQKKYDAIDKDYILFNTMIKPKLFTNYTHEIVSLLYKICCMFIFISITITTKLSKVATISIKVLQPKFLYRKTNKFQITCRVQWWMKQYSPEVKLCGYWGQLITLRKAYL